MNSEKTKEPLLDCLNDKQLSAIIFVQDYVQLDFQGNHVRLILTAIVWPIIRVRGKAFKFGDLTYCDEFQKLVRKNVARVFLVKGEKIQIELDDKSTLEISLHEEDCSGPEAVTLQTSDGKQFNVWGPGYP